MNWAEFKEAVEAAGVTDDMEVDSIDVCDCDPEDLTVNVNTGPHHNWFVVFR